MCTGADHLQYKLDKFLQFSMKHTHLFIQNTTQVAVIEEALRSVEMKWYHFTQCKASIKLPNTWNLALDDNSSISLSVLKML